MHKTPLPQQTVAPNLPPCHLLSVSVTCGNLICCHFRLLCTVVRLRSLTNLDIFYSLFYLLFNDTKFSQWNSSDFWHVSPCTESFWPISNQTKETCDELTFNRSSTHHKIQKTIYWVCLVNVAELSSVSRYHFLACLRRIGQVPNSKVRTKYTLWLVSICRFQIWFPFYDLTNHWKVSFFPDLT